MTRKCRTQNRYFATVRALDLLTPDRKRIWDKGGVDSAKPDTGAKISTQKNKMVVFNEMRLEMVPSILKEREMKISERVPSSGLSKCREEAF